MPDSFVEQLTQMECAEAAIDLFLEYRDAHGYDEDVARAKALNEVSEGLRATQDLGADPTVSRIRDAADSRPRYGDPTIYECQFEVASAVGGGTRIRVCGYVQRGPGACPYPHATADGEPVGLTALLTQPYGRKEPTDG